MRDILNGILSFIGAASLTDPEFASLTIADTSDDNLTYLDLLAVLTSRESLSSEKERLKLYFLSKGATLDTVTTGKTNIYLGDVLEY